MEIWLVKLIVNFFGTNFVPTFGYWYDKEEAEAFIRELDEHVTVYMQSLGAEEWERNGYLDSATNFLNNHCENVENFARSSTAAVLNEQTLQSASVVSLELHSPK